MGLITRMLNRIVCLFVILLNTSCATLSKEQCEQIDWFQKGREEALGGERQGKVHSYSERCENVGAKINQQAFLAGYDEGLKIFCTQESGYKHGLAGEAYGDICPPGSSEAFLKGYNAGAREFRLQKREQELKKREEEVARKEKLLTRFGTKECTYDSDCTIQNTCSFGKCANDGQKCSFNSDCKQLGRCSFERICDGNCETLRVCKY
jgi:hypothetical protein